MGTIYDEGNSDINGTCNEPIDGGERRESGISIHNDDVSRNVEVTIVLSQNVSCPLFQCV